MIASTRPHAARPHVSRRTRVALVAALALAAWTLAAAAPGLASATAAPAGGVDLPRLEVGAVKLYSGFDSPLYVTGARDGTNRLFVVERGGLVKVVRDGVVQPAPYLDLRSLVNTSAEELGLIGFAFAPGYRTNGRFYVFYADSPGSTVLVRYVATNPLSDTPSVTAQRVVMRLTQPTIYHRSGCLQFGRDGYLYVGTGDGGPFYDPYGHAQSKRSLLGKILRIDTGDKPGKKLYWGTYRVPRDNPLYNRKKVRREIWSYGLRNPWRFSFDSATGDLWIGDVGQDSVEEIDFARAGVGGQNWGWARWEGNVPTPGQPRNLKKRGYSFPIARHPHPQAEAIVGGYVYRGSKYPALRGTYVYGDFINGWIAAVRRTAPSGKLLKRPQYATMLQTTSLISSFGTDDARELYFTDYADGSVWQVTGVAK